MQIDEEILERATTLLCADRGIEPSAENLAEARSEVRRHMEVASAIAQATYVD